MAAGSNVRLPVYIGALSAAALALAVAASGIDAPLGNSEPWAVLLPLGALVVAAEYLFVRFRFGGETNALNLMEAVIAPIAVVYPPTVAIVAVAVSQIVAATVRRNSPMKAAFNVAQWSVATGCASLVIGAFEPRISDLRLGLAVVVALVVVALVNQAAFTVVLSLANRQRITEVIAALRPVILPGWVAGWMLNSAIGMLFVFAIARSPWATLLFPVPLAVLHFAYRGYAGARTDRMRLTGVHRAVGALAQPLDPGESIGAFLGEVAASFDAREALLVLASGDMVAVYGVERSSGELRVRYEPLGQSAIVERGIDVTAPTRITNRSAPRLQAFLAETGARDALVAPLVEGDHRSGFLLVLDQGGLEGFEEGELAVLDALARETAGTFAKGKLLETVLEERRTTAEIVDSTSDGILTVDYSGVIRAWNAALESITGFAAAEAIGRRAGLVLRATNSAGEPVHLDRWSDGEALPSQLNVVAADGSQRLLSCSYGRTPSQNEGKLVVIARDLAPVQRLEDLRREFGRLAEAEAAQRQVVAALHDALLPPPPIARDTAFAVTYVASDEHAPTGGDLYDWQLLPDGTVHVAVTDVLGHGVTATRHALMVISTVRLLALQGCPLHEIVAKADALLHDQDPDLVATISIARYDPATGRVTLVAGGHPPALLVSRTGQTEQLSAPGCAIGWPNAGSEVIVDAELAPGASLVLYTDGLVEARRNILEGLDQLVAHASELAALPAQDLVDALVDRALAGADRRDDSLALVIRRLPARVGPATRNWSFAAEPSAAGSARRSVRDFLGELDVDGEVVDDLVTIVSELMTNASQAGARNITVRAAVDEEAGMLSLDVGDDGRGDIHLDDEGRALPADDDDHGRGLFIVRALSDQVSMLSTAEGTSVRVERSLVRAPSLSASLPL